MPDSQQGPQLRSTLSTKLEEDFIAPLTAIRGALEILRDYPDLSEAERERFLKVALSGCAHLEHGVNDLGNSVYAAARQTGDDGARDAQDTQDWEAKRDETTPPAVAMPENDAAARVRFIEDAGRVEVDFQGMEFRNSKAVNAFYDVLDDRVRRTGRRWYFLVNYSDCSVWPEAWVAFAHRGKKVNVSYSLGTARYAQARDKSAGLSADTHDSRESALAHLEALRQKGSTRGRG